MARQHVKLQDIKLNEDELALLKPIQEQEPHRAGDLLGFVVVEKGEATRGLLDKLQTEKVIAGYVTDIFGGGFEVLDEKDKPMPDSLVFLVDREDAQALGATLKKSGYEQLVSGANSGTNKSAFQR